jgi:hypothetical protein
MNLVVNEELFAIETIISRTQFLNNKPSERYSFLAMLSIADERKDKDADMELCNKRCYTFYSDDEKTRFFYLFFNKGLSASAAPRRLDSHIHATQRCVKRY